MCTVTVIVMMILMMDDADVEIVSCNTDSTSTHGSYSSADHVSVSCNKTSDKRST